MRALIIIVVRSCSACMRTVAVLSCSNKNSETRTQSRSIEQQNPTCIHTMSGDTSSLHESPPLITSTCNSSQPSSSTYSSQIIYTITIITSPCHTYRLGRPHSPGTLRSEQSKWSTNGHPPTTQWIPRNSDI